MAEMQPGESQRVNFETKSFVFLWNVLLKKHFLFYMVIILSAAMSSVGVYISQNLFFTVNKHVLCAFSLPSSATRMMRPNFSSEDLVTCASCLVTIH